MVASSESRCPTLGRAEPDAPRLAGRRAALPRPVFLVEPVRCRLVKELVVVPLVHCLGSLGPPRPRSTRSSYNQTPGLGQQLDFVAQLCLLQQGPGYPNTLRVAYANNPRLGRHVITS